MDDLHRTFVAVDIEPGTELNGIINELKVSLGREGIRWVRDGSLHLTLKFLGDTKPEKLNGIISILSDIGNRYKAFSCGLQGLGYFKSKGVPKVLYAKIINENILVKLAEEIDCKLSEAGFERELRTFSPHLTLARIKNFYNRPAFYRLIDKYDKLPHQKVTINEFIFYQSILTPRGPEYRKLAVIKLNQITCHFL